APGGGAARRYWLLYRTTDSTGPALEATTDLLICPRCNAIEEVIVEDRPEKVAPHVQVEVRWQGVSALFPVRFLNKAELPLLLLGRKPSEGELIDYFLFGREPAETEDELIGRDKGAGAGADDPLDTRRILAYFMRRF